MQCVAGGTSPNWTCFPPDSTSFHSLSHLFRTPRHGQWMHSACPGRIWTHMPSHQQPSWGKLQDYPCHKIILIAPGWPNMPWFWDLVTMSSNIALCLPNLVTQPFSSELQNSSVSICSPPHSDPSY